jgi:hypothetical protein
MIGSLITLLIYALIVIIILSLVWWVLTMIPLPAPFAKIAQVVIVVIACLILILLLLNFIGLEPGRPLLR